LGVRRWRSGTEQRQAGERQSGDDAVRPQILMKIFLR
jgi:hypothetical protein